MSDPESRRAWEAVERRLRAVEEHLPDAPPPGRMSPAVGPRTVRVRTGTGAASAVPLIILAAVIVGVALITRGTDERAGDISPSPSGTTVVPATPSGLPAGLRIIPLDEPELAPCGPISGRLVAARVAAGSDLWSAFPAVPKPREAPELEGATMVPFVIYGEGYVYRDGFPGVSHGPAGTAPPAAAPTGRSPGPRWPVCAVVAARPIVFPDVPLDGSPLLSRVLAASGTPSTSSPGPKPSLRVLDTKSWPMASPRWHGYRVRLCVPRGRQSLTYVGADARLVLATGASIPAKNGHGAAGVAPGDDPPFWLSAQEQWIDKATLAPGRCVVGWLVFATADRTPARLSWYGTAVPLTASSAASDDPSSPDTGRATVTAERDGVRVTMSLDRRRLRAGEPAWLTTEVRNVGAGDIVWAHDGCGLTASVRAALEGIRWRPGITHQGKAARFKRFALGRQEIEDGTIELSFVPEPFVGIGRYGCADVRVEERIKPGRAIRQRAQWDGFAGLGLGPPPAGRVRLVGSFGSYWRARAGEPARITDQVIEVPLEVSLASARDPNALDPPEVVDAALTSAPFRAWVESQDLRPGTPVDPVLVFDPAAGVWKVGLLQRGLDEYHLALVHPVSGRVIAIVDEPWDPARDSDRDGYPDRDPDGPT